MANKLTYADKLGQLKFSRGVLDKDIHKTDLEALDGLFEKYEHRLNALKENPRPELKLGEEEKELINRLYTKAAEATENWYGKSHMRDKEGYTAFDAGGGKPTHYPGKSK